MVRMAGKTAIEGKQIMLFTKDLNVYNMNTLKTVICHCISEYVLLFFFFLHDYLHLHVMI